MHETQLEESMEQVLPILLPIIATLSIIVIGIKYDLWRIVFSFIGKLWPSGVMRRNKYSGKRYKNYLGFGSRLIDGDEAISKNLPIGYKRLELHTNGYGMWFQSPTHHSNIAMGITSEAFCDETIRPHDVPDAKCSCGFYSFKNFKSAVNYDASNSVVVELIHSGKYIEHSKGWRAQKQRISTIYTPKICMATYACRNEAIALKRPDYSSEAVIGICDRHARKAELADLITFDEIIPLLKAKFPDERVPKILHRSSEKPLTREEIHDFRKRSLLSQR